ncbi:hypothetical protein PRIC1_000360 [Phytophthora ramorum]
MLTESASLTAPLDSGERRAEARHRRREAAAPYPSSKREKEEEEEFFAETAPATHTRGFFSRLASYIPIVGKLVNEEEAPASDEASDVQTTQEDEEEEEEYEEEEAEKEEAEKEEILEPEQTQEDAPMQPQVEQQKEQTPEDEEMLDAPASPVTRATPSFVTHKEQLATPPRHHNKRGSRKSRSPSRDSGMESEERSPAMLRQQRKRGDKRVFLPGPSQQSKMLRISNTQRRRKSPSPSPHDSALTVIKQKKTISLEEFERLQHQLHEMVEPTPQAALAMTQAALANGLERPFTRGFPGPMSFPGYVPGSIANQSHGALVVQDERKQLVPKNGVPFGKRPRNHENGPILFSGSTLRGQLTREERLMRKPRPSRLLTGAKRDAAARNAYSAAVAEKILSTLNRVQTPLEREAQKPTPSTSMSWTKYHLSLVDGQKSLENGMEIDSDDVPPPTTTVPRVAFPQPTQKPSTLSFGNAPQSTYETPAKSSTGSSNGVTPLFSHQIVSMTPALAAKAPQPKFETFGQFKFTLPINVEGAQQVSADDEDSRVLFVFSPPASMREPPVKASSQKTAAKGNGGAAPFDFMPSSPKVKTTEWVSKPPKAKESEKLTVAAKTPAAPKGVEKPSSTGPASVASMSGAVNPLARFMQLKPGQWKCPGCSVLNEATSAKCPCCETANPGGASAKVAGPAASKTLGSISSIGFSFGVPASDDKKDTNKPAAGSITTGGFSFGAPPADSMEKTEKPAGSISSGEFSFGVPAADAKKDTNKPAAGITPGGFSFTAPVEKPAGGFSFGAPAASEANADASESTAPISFGFSAPAKKIEDSSSEEATATPAVTENGQTTQSFSFGVPAASASASAVTSTSASGGFTFGAASSSTLENSNNGKRKAPEAEEPKKGLVPSFSFGASTPATTETPKSSTTTGFSFGAAPEPSSPKESDRPKKRAAVSFGTADSKPEASIPAFSFGTAVKPPQMPAKDNVGVSSTPSFGFGGSSTSTTTTTEKPKETVTFSFGTSSTDKGNVAMEVKPKKSLAPTTGFTFGSSSTTTAAPAVKPSMETKAPGFSFGTSSASAAPATSAPAASSTGFTFGQSSTAPATSNAPAFGAAPATSSATPAFSFGAPTSTPPAPGTSTPPIGQLSSAPSSTPGFTFGASAAANPAASSGFGSLSGPAFGQAPATTSGFGSTTASFGSSTPSGFGSGPNAGAFGNTSASAPATSFGSSTSTAPTAPAFSFGASSAASAPAPAAAQPAFSFGASSAPASSGFGAAPSGFGSNVPANGFSGAAAPGGFRSSSPAPAFGNQPAPAFGSSLPPPSTTFGAPAFGAPAASGFGSGPSSSGFRTPSPTPAFGGAQTQAPVPAFGAPNTGFGAAAPAPGFGAAPTAAAFGAPADGGFNMGAAPQHAKGRRILKAKSRARRTS